MVWLMEEKKLSKIAMNVRKSRNYQNQRKLRTETKLSAKTRKEA